jgi:hypothetical protein
MRACEFILENAAGKLELSVASALPAAYILPELSNQNAYLQYRFGVALAAVRGEKQRKLDGSQEFYSTSAWGENQVVVAYAKEAELDQVIDGALKLMGKSKKVLTSTPTSKESPTVNTRSPVSNWNKNND